MLFSLVTGASRGIGGEGDRTMFHALRTVVDGVLVGSGTLRAERYGRLVRDPARRSARAALGLAEDPVAVGRELAERVEADLEPRRVDDRGSPGSGPGGGLGGGHGGSSRSVARREPDAVVDVSTISQSG